MKHLALFVAVLIFSWCTTAYGFRCGEGGKLLASKGMNKYEILKDCGPPVSKEITAINKNGNSYQKIEEWVYIVDEYGHKQMYLVRIDKDGIVAKIEWLGEQK